jgi:hypothetical protein
MFLRNVDIFRDKDGDNTFIRNAAKFRAEDRDTMFL